MFYDEISTKQDFSYISISLLGILYNIKIILMVTPLGLNAVVVTRSHCICKEIIQTEIGQGSYYGATISNAPLNDDARSLLFIEYRNCPGSAVSPLQNQ